MTENYNYSVGFKPAGGAGTKPQTAAASLQSKVRMASQALAEGRFRAAELMFKMLAAGGETRVQTRLNLGMAVLYQARWWEGAMILHLALLSAAPKEREPLGGKLQKNLQAWAEHVYKQGLAADRQDLLALVQALFPLPESGLQLAVRWLPRLSAISRYDVARDMIAWLRDTDTEVPVGGEDIRQLAGALINSPGGDRLIIQLAEALRLNTTTPEDYGASWAHLQGLAIHVAGDRKRGVREVLGLMLDNALSNHMEPDIQRDFMQGLLRGMFGFDYRDKAVDAYRGLLHELNPDVDLSRPCVDAGPQYQLYAIEHADRLLRECMASDLSALFEQGHADPDHALGRMISDVGSASFVRASRDPSLEAKQGFERALMPRLVREIEKRAGQLSLSPLPAAPAHKPGSPIRVGYLTRHAHGHIIGRLMGNFLPLHSDALEVFVYDAANMPRKDAVSMQIAAAVKRVHWGRIVDLASAGRLAAKIRDDDIDLLVDLDGATDMEFALLHYFRPARASAVMLGWDSPGLPYIDYYLSDPHGLAQDAQDYYLERVERVRRCAFLGAGLDVRADPDTRAQARKHIGIGHDQLAYLVAAPGRKISVEVAEDAMRVLQTVPNALLLVKGQGHAAHIRGFWQGRAESMGLDPTRIINLPFTDTLEGHHAQLQAADVVLDTFPATGGGHSMENLWFGNPIVTRVGETFPSRITYSMLMNLDLAETIARDRDEYVNIAIRLGTDAPFREDIRRRLQDSVDDKTGLWGVRTLVEDLECTYRHILDRTGQGGA